MRKSAEEIRARRAAKLDAYIREVVDRAPALTDHQIARLSVVLQGSSVSHAALARTRTPDPMLVGEAQRAWCPTPDPGPAGPRDLT